MAENEGLNFRKTDRLKGRKNLNGWKKTEWTAEWMKEKERQHERMTMNDMSEWKDYKDIKMDDLEILSKRKLNIYELEKMDE